MFTKEERSALDKISQIADIDQRFNDLMESIKSHLVHPQDFIDHYFKKNDIILRDKESNLFKKIEEFKKNEAEFKTEIETDRNAIKSIINEKTLSFPWLTRAFSDYYYLKNLKEAKNLRTKSHPAPKAAKKVTEIAKKRKIVEEKLRFAQYTIEYYHQLFPFLEEFTGDIDDDTLKLILSRNIEDKIEDVDGIGVDPVTIYLSPEEYKKLPTVDRNQLALDRYWTKRKSKWQIGKDYERFVGYLYEYNGYNVYYKGILEGFDDLGRDLICKKDNFTIIVQCKRWSKYKTIHEKHINQLYGTVVKYILDNPEEKVGGSFWTSTNLSDRAKEFADYLNIDINESKQQEIYPSIKCNISKKSGEKIYHLPFDQQYDRTIIEEEKNEAFVQTVKEAESLGFRRAWRWHGDKNR